MIRILIIIDIIIYCMQILYADSKSTPSDYSLYEIYKNIYSFKRIYKDTNLNVFGAILFILFQTIICPISAAAYFIYWLCHKKEEE